MEYTYKVDVWFATGYGYRTVLTTKDFEAALREARSYLSADAKNVAIRNVEEDVTLWEMR